MVKYNVFVCVCVYVIPTACDSSCATCYPDNPKCTSCPQGSAMHQGKCISYCPEQHYLDAHGRCRACHSSCWSCSGPSVSQCTLCSQGLSLHHGQCLEACGEGLYHQDQTCHSKLPGLGLATVSTPWPVSGSLRRRAVPPGSDLPQPSSGVVTV
uniref:TNFR-Cys domain-containing protein n=1 Tax=Hucho hucho TaxID=62062 RepID=A0A4W5KNY5_9TELE